MDRAFEDIEEALDNQPDLAPAYLSRGNAYIARGSAGDLAMAVTEFSRAIDLAPDSPVAYFNRGLVYSETEDWGQIDLRSAAGAGIESERCDVQSHSLLAVGGDWRPGRGAALPRIHRRTPKDGVRTAEEV